METNYTSETHSSYTRREVPGPLEILEICLEPSAGLLCHSRDIVETNRQRGKELVCATSTLVLGFRQTNEKVKEQNDTEFCIRQCICKPVLFPETRMIPSV